MKSPWLLAVSLLACGGERPAAVPNEKEPDEPQEASLELVVASASIRVTQGDSTTLEVELLRGGSFDGLVSISLDGLPPGVAAPSVTVSAGASTATLAVAADEDAPHAGPVVATVRAAAADDSGPEDEVELATFVAGPPGALDTSFATGGERLLTVTTRKYDTAVAATIDAEGRLVVAGNGVDDLWLAFVARFLPDGSLDEAFGDAGVTLFEDGIQTDSHAILALADGSLLWSATLTTEEWAPWYYLRKLLPDGTVDVDFGVAGGAPLPCAAHDLLVRDQGILLLCPPHMFALDANGRFDPDFGFERLAGPPSMAAFEPDGSGGALVAFGSAAPGEAPTLARVDPEGAFDPTFGEDGSAAFPVIDGRIADLDPHPAGGVLMLGSSTPDAAAETSLARFDVEGRPDPSFGVGGHVVVGPGRAIASAVTADGAVLVVSTRPDGDATRVVLRRYLPNGELDESFGTDGAVEVHPGELVVDERAHRAILVGTQAGGGLHLQRLWL